MNFSAFVARRYLFSKKSHNVINIISMISVFGVSTGTMALIIVLSIMNGFNDLIKSVYSTFDPDFKITVVEGKTFDPTLPVFDSISNLNIIDLVCPTLEENVLLEYEEKMHAAVIKGVPSDYINLTGVDTMMLDGEFILNDGHQDKMVIGSGVAYYLSVGINFLSPIVVYVPKRKARISTNPAHAFNKKYIFPSGVFSIQHDIDTRYVLSSIEFVRDLLGYPRNVSAVEIKLKQGADNKKAQATIAKMLGADFVVKNKSQQHETIFKVMKSEKLAIYLILTFILIVASFNIIGSLSMLIIDKHHDITTLQSLGIDKDTLRRIFLYEGYLITICGAIIGLIIGGAIVWAEDQFGFLKLENMGSFLVDSYPVKIQAEDFLIVFVTVVVIGLLASWYPVKHFTKRYLKDLDTN